MVVPILVVLGLAFVIGAIGTVACIALGTRAGMLDTPGAHGKHLCDVPNIGGIAIAWPLIGAVGFVAILGMTGDTGVLVDLVPGLEPWTDRLASSSADAAWFAVALLILHVMGVLDDRRGISSRIRLCIQIVLALVLVLVADIRMLSQLDEMVGLGPVPSVVLTVAWIVVITNAMNFLDNMDGLTAGVTVIAGGLLLATALMSSQWFVAGTLAILVGTTAGFLVFNFPPARIFMGDGGSTVIGFALGVLVVRITYWSPDEAHQTLGSGWYGVLMPLCALAIPIYDITSVTLLRLRQGRSPFEGDTQHFSHRLVEIGLSKRRAVVVIWALSGITGAIGLLLGHLPPWLAILAGVQVLLVLVVLAMLETGARR